ncbi:hypothetical protein U9M49_13230 [Cytobacillus sp. OWB-43]|nr:hypothetical protein [Cytobacillus sp. OWB-43]
MILLEYEGNIRFSYNNVKYALTLWMYGKKVVRTDNIIGCSHRRYPIQLPTSYLLIK